MKTITTLVLLFISVVCFGQVKPQPVKVDSIALNQFEVAQLKLYDQREQDAQRLFEKANDLMDKVNLLRGLNKTVIDGIENRLDKVGKTVRISKDFTHLVFKKD